MAGARAQGSDGERLKLSLDVLLKQPQAKQAGGRRVSSCAGVSLEPETVPRGAQKQWGMFFAARPALPLALRPRTATGKPKRQLPRLPPNINERRKLHYRVEADLIAYWRDYAARESRRHGMPRPLGRVRITAVVYRRNLGVADGPGDAERLKPLVDGLVAAGVLVNDRRREVEYGEVREEHVGYRGEGILMIVDELEPAGQAPSGRGRVASDGG